MSNIANNVSLRRCPNCGLELPSSGWEGLCPRCLVSVSLRAAAQTSARLANASGFAGNDEAATDVPAAQSGISSQPEYDVVAAVSGKGRNLGDYQLLEEIGRGGMGVVFKARQLSLNRIVAVKLLLAGPLAGGKRVERFRAEAAAVARLQHPNIVAIYGVGEQEGTPFFSMEYVPGRTLGDLVAERPLAAEAAARHMEIIAEAIQYAHEQGIVHRDLKPSNVLIDTAGRPRVTDFGLAKRLPSSSDAPAQSAASQITLTGQVLGSPSYLAPEQAGEAGGVVGPACDIYALGAILFHLLTGRPPFLSETLEGTLLQVLTTEPIPVRRLNPAVPRDLETICLKCLQKEAARRYRSAAALAADLQRFLVHEPILARPVNPVEKLWRWCRWRPALAGVLLLLLLSFGGGAGGVFWQWRRARGGEVSLQRNLYAADVNLAQVAIQDNNLGRATALLGRYIPRSKTEPDLRGFEWHYLWSLCHGDEQASLGGESGVVSCVRYSPDGRLIASAGFDRAVTLWDPSTQKPLTRLTGLSGPVCRLGLSLSPDGNLIAAAGGTNLLVWNTKDWTIAARLEAHAAALGGGGYQVAFSPDGRRLAARLKEDLYLWEIATWQKSLIITGAVQETASLLGFSADGKVLASYNHNHIHFWEAGSGRLLVLSADNLGQPFGLAFAPRGTLLAVAETSGTLKLLDALTGQTVRSVDAHKNSAQCVAFSQDGTMLATGGVDQFVRLWDAETLTNVAVFKGHQSEVWSVAFSPDGETLASASKDGTVKLWKVRPAGAAVKALDTIATPLWFSPDGTVLLTRNRNGSLHYWDVNTAREKRAIPPLKTGSERYFTTVSSDGKYLATSVEDGRIFIWDLESGLPLWTNRVDSNPANALAFSPDNRLLALSAGLYNGGTWNGGTWLLDLGSGRAELLSPDYCGTRDCADLAFARDGKLLAGVGPDYTVRIWDVETRKLRSVLRGPTWHITTMAFSPDARLLAGGANDNTARLWDVATGAPVAALTGHKTGIVQLAFTPDGRTLATSGSDRTVRFWNLATHRELMTLKTATTWTHFLFSPDGHALATGGLSGPLELWHAPP